MALWALFHGAGWLDADPTIQSMGFESLRIPATASSPKARSFIREDRVDTAANDGALIAGLR